MRVLVYDFNSDFAAQTAEFINDNIRNWKADTASNLFILRKRLRDNTYDLVLADTLTSPMSSSVSSSLEQLTCPVILWTCINQGALLSSHSIKNLVQKPTSPAEIPSKLRTLVEVA